MSFFPKNKGMSVGLASIGPSLASVFWSVFAVNYINYYLEEPAISIQEGKKNVRYFSKDQKIIDNVASFFGISALLTFTMGLIILIRYRNKEHQTETNPSKRFVPSARFIESSSIIDSKESIKQRPSQLRTVNFWLHFFMNLYLTSVPVFFNVNIKITG